jgi:predicted Zn-dependent protease
MVAVGVAAVLVVAASATPASAHYYSSGMPVSSFSVRLSYPTNDWFYPISRAMSNWSNHSRVTISSNSSASNLVRVQYRTESWYGLYERSSSSSFVITINSRRVPAPTGNGQNFIQSVTAHEFGHALSLWHNSLDSIMNTSRDRYSLYTYRPHDSADVTCYYYPSGDRRGPNC